MLVQSPSLLITDDDREFRETLREAFEPKGFRTILAGDDPWAADPQLVASSTSQWAVELCLGSERANHLRQRPSA